ncbi:MAG: hypothetical protein AAF456_23645 [Planctomycetota bacterium]
MSDALSGGPSRGLNRILALVRENSFGPSGWQTLIEESGLPPAVKETIFSVLRTARLWQSEKLSIAKELIAHFQDGYDRGVSFDQLLREFGDPALASALIQRSKERNRPMISKIARATGIFVLLMLALGLCVYLYFLAGTAVPQEDYLAEINGPARAGQEQPHAWPVYRTAWIDHDFLRADTSGLNVQSTGELAGPEDAEWAAAISLADEYAGLTEAMREGSRLENFGLKLELDIADYSPEDQAALFPHWVPPAVDAEPVGEFGDDLIIGVLLPHVHGFQSAADFLRFDAKRASHDGDAERVCDNIRAIFGIGRHANERPIVVSTFVAFSVHHKGLMAIEDVLTGYPDLLSEAELEELQSLVAGYDYRQFIKLEGERAMVMDLLQHTYTDDGNGDGRMTNEGLSAFFSVIPAMTVGPDEDVLTNGIGGFFRLATSSRKDVAEAYDDLLEVFEETLDSPIYEKALSDDLERYRSVIEEGSAEDLVLRNLAPSMTGIRANLERMISRQSAVILALSLERFKLTNGQYPESIDQLVPDQLALLPRDRCIDEVLKLKFESGMPVIYSVGVDGVDDGGVPHMTVPNKRYSPDIRLGGTSDWILWPWIEMEEK